jgi:hypothetical protein
VQLVNYCWLGDEANVKCLLKESPGLASKISGGDRRAVADAARERNLTALRRFLDAGFPIDAPGQHQATGLHWAAWHGNTAAVAELVKRGAPLEAKDADYQSTPLHWAMHGSENGWFHDEGDYPGVANLLLTAGAQIPAKIIGTPEVQSVVRNFSKT